MKVVAKSDSESTEAPPKALRKVFDEVKDLPEPADDPIGFVVELGREWKVRGGSVSGKPRHSDRYLNDILRHRETLVKSLTPKLKGSTGLKSADITALLDVFFSLWAYTGEPDKASSDQASEDKISSLYTPLLSDSEIEEVSQYVMSQTLRTEMQAPTLPVAAQAELPGYNTADLIADRYEETDAMFSVSAEHTLIATHPKRVLINFRNLVNRLWASDAADDQDRVIIWILDLGRQDFEDLESRLKFVNVHTLITRLKALKFFKETDSEKRWEWLCSRSVVILYDIRRGAPPATRLPVFAAHHVLLSATPPAWGASTPFRALYGSNFERLAENNYSIFVKKPDDDISSSIDGHEIKYFGHATFKRDQASQQETQARALELPSPGGVYDLAFVTAYRGAAHTLNMHDGSPKSLKEGKAAVDAFNHIGFYFYNLDDFVEL